MTWYSVDVEADGPIPGDYSMTVLGAVRIDPEQTLTDTFYAQLKPISDLWLPDAQAVSGFTREEALAFPDPKVGMESFANWVRRTTVGQPIFIADNNGFDWSFVNWYMWHFTGDNPFGFSSRNLNDLYKGITKNFRASIKHLRITKHDHNPVNDAKGNAEAFLHIVNNCDYKVKL